MKNNYAKFVCDECNKESKEIKEGNSHFPYEDGWRYLHRLNFKMNKDKNNTIDDKHFCSAECMRTHIDKNIKESEAKPESDPLEYEEGN